MSARQFYFVLFTFVISLKIQKLPCLIYDFLGKDSFVLYLLFMVIDLVLIILAFYLSKKLKVITEQKLKGSRVMEFTIKVLAIFVSAYFLCQSILFYESIQDLFSHILFDNLSWKVFSLFLLSSMFFLASFKFENIGRVCEVFFALILCSLIVLGIFGGVHTDFSEVLPLQTIFKRDYLVPLKNFNIWFGDFFLVLFLGVYAKDIKLKYTILSYVLAILSATFFVIEFNGIFLLYSPMQSSLISVISEQSLLGIDIGRFDWFLILISEFGTVIGASLCLCLSRRAISKTFPKFDKKIVLFILVAVIYFTDTLYLIDVYTKKKFFFEFVANFALFIKIASLIVLVLKIWHFSDKIKYAMKTQMQSLNESEETEINAESQKTMNLNKSNKKSICAKNAIFSKKSKNSAILSGFNAKNKKNYKKLDKLSKFKQTILPKVCGDICKISKEILPSRAKKRELKNRYFAVTNLKMVVDYE